MSEIDDRLRAAMHAAVDGEEMPTHVFGVVVRRQRRRRVLALGIAVLVALAVAVPGLIALRAALAPSPAPSTNRHGTAPPKRLPTKLTGQPWPAGTNLRLLLNAPRAEWFSTATRRAEPITGLPAAFYFFFRVNGGWTAEQFRGGSGCPPRCNEPQYFIADGSLTARRIGSGFPTKASDQPGAVWLQTYPAGTRNTGTTPASAQLVTTAGRPLGPRYRLPVGYLLDRGVGGYLLLYPTRSAKPPDVYELWDPSTGKVVRHLDNVAGASADQIAFSPACRDCRMQILTVSTGKTVATPIAGYQPSGLFGTFTDDGRLLAVMLPSGATVVYDIQRQDLTMIPGTILANDVATSFGWLDGSHRLVIEATPDKGSSARTQIAYWQPGDSRLRVATFYSFPGASSIVFDGAN
jgi:hypothetical protein